MKRKFQITLLYILYILLFAGCKETVVEPVYSEDYFPLNFGNKWYYSSLDFRHMPDTTGRSEIWEVIGNKEIDGKSCAAVKTTQFSSPGIIAYVDTAYYYAKDGKLYSAYKDDSGSLALALYADFTLNEGDKFISDLHHYSYNVRVSEKTDSTMSFYYDVPQYADEEFSVTFKKNTGVQKRVYYFGTGIQLQRAELK